MAAFEVIIKNKQEGKVLLRQDCQGFALGVYGPDGSAGTYSNLSAQGAAFILKKMERDIVDRQMDEAEKQSPITVPNLAIADILKRSRMGGGNDKS